MSKPKTNFNLFIIAPLALLGPEEPPLGANMRIMLSLVAAYFLTRLFLAIKTEQRGS